MEGIWMVIAGAVYLWVTQPTGIWECSIWTCRMPPHEPGYVPSTAPTFSARVRSSAGSWRGILIGSTSSGPRAECYQRPMILIFRCKSSEFQKLRNFGKSLSKGQKRTPSSCVIGLKGPRLLTLLYLVHVQGMDPLLLKKCPCELHPSI